MSDHDFINWIQGFVAGTNGEVPSPQAWKTFITEVRAHIKQTPSISKTPSAVPDSGFNPNRYPSTNPVPSWVPNTLPSWVPNPDTYWLTSTKTEYSSQVDGNVPIKTFNGDADPFTSTVFRNIS